MCSSLSLVSHPLVSRLVGNSPSQKQQNMALYCSLLRPHIHFCPISLSPSLIFIIFFASICMLLDGGILAVRTAIIVTVCGLVSTVIAFPSHLQVDINHPMVFTRANSRVPFPQLPLKPPTSLCNTTTGTPSDMRGITIRTVPSSCSSRSIFLPRTMNLVGHFFGHTKSTFSRLFLARTTYL